MSEKRKRYVIDLTEEQQRILAPLWDELEETFFSRRPAMTIGQMMNHQQAFFGLLDHEPGTEEIRIMRDHIEGKDKDAPEAEEFAKRLAQVKDLYEEFGNLATSDFEWLIDQLESATVALAQAQDLREAQRAAVSLMCDRVEELQAKLDRYTEALEKYANEDNWLQTHNSNGEHFDKWWPDDEGRDLAERTLRPPRIVYVYTACSAKGVEIGEARFTDKEQADKFAEFLKASGWTWTEKQEAIEGSR